MNLPLSMALRPSSLLILLAYGALIGVVLLMPCWYVMVTHVEKHMNLNSENIMSQLQSETEVLHPLKSSSTNLARLLTSNLHTNSTSFSDIQTKVAPILFQEFETLPYLTQISYMGMEGLFFSYYNDDDQVIALYSNSSSSPSSSWGASRTNKTLYYTQPVNRENGEVYGEAMLSNFSINASWIQEALNFSHGFSSLATKWSNGHDLLFLCSSRIKRTGGVISLGFSANAITDSVTRINRQGTSSYLATKDGKILVEGIQHTNLVISNDTVSFQSVNANGNLTSNEGTVSCKGEAAAATSLNIQDTEYLIHCYPIDIMGIESVFVLAVPQNGSVSFDLSNMKKGLALMIVMMVMVFIAMFSFLFINGRALRREMHLCASLIKQMEATQQAERKNMNKSLAFASASHDIRNSLACLTALIEMSHELVDPNSELETNLKQMEGCTQDLIGLLNSTLDTSKTEAGKMELQEEEFDVSNLLEDVVDFHHPLGMEKGVDLVLDPCDGSVIRYSRVKGDRVKLKQVLCNLISNAVKFTDEGHVTVRAWVQKQMQHDTRSMDFMFEVDDTGKGIPKEKYISVFENYVQVKETGSGQGGTGLGLGIVKSLVHLMHGDIGIMDKDIGEKGTCFRFNVHLTLSDSETMLNYGSSAISKEDLEYGPSDMNQANTSFAASNICSISPRLHVCSFSSRPEASQVILLLANEERRRTSQRFMESLEIKVKVVKQWKNLFDTLIKIKGHNSDGQCSPIESSDSSCWSTPHDSFLKARGVPMAGVKYMMSSVLKKTGNGAAPGFILIVIDANAGRFSELYRIVSNFKKELPNPCKVVWLDNPLQRSINSKAIDENDDVISKPFHGSHLFQVIKLLPEYGGALESRSSKAKTEGTLHVCSKAPVHQGETQECGDSSNRKPLSGRKFLLVEDNKLARKVAKATLERLGATIDECENGKHAVRLVYECLNQKSPYDYILMDCHMPDMDGFQATRRIREMEMEMEMEKEKSYVVPIPIIALTGLTENITAEAGNGIDFHIVKPINRENLLEAIRHIHTRKSGIK